MAELKLHWNLPVQPCVCRGGWRPRTSRGPGGAARAPSRPLTSPLPSHWAHTPLNTALSAPSQGPRSAPAEGLGGGGQSRTPTAVAGGESWPQRTPGPPSPSSAGPCFKHHSLPATHLLLALGAAEPLLHLCTDSSAHAHQGPRAALGLRLLEPGPQAGCPPPLQGQAGKVGHGQWSSLQPHLRRLWVSVASPAATPGPQPQALFPSDPPPAGQLVLSKAGGSPCSA